MDRTFSHLEQINMIGKLADLKERLDQDNLVLHALIELLIDKGMISRQELTEKSELIEQRATNPS